VVVSPEAAEIDAAIKNLIETIQAHSAGAAADPAASQPPAPPGSGGTEVPEPQPVPPSDEHARFEAFYQSLPLGAYYQDPDGLLRRKPEGQV
jgi:hypothetical protein